MYLKIVIINQEDLLENNTLKIIVGMEVEKNNNHLNTHLIMSKIIIKIINQKEAQDNQVSNLLVIIHKQINLKIKRNSLVKRIIEIYMLIKINMMQEIL